MVIKNNIVLEPIKRVDKKDPHIRKYNFWRRRSDKKRLRKVTCDFYYIDTNYSYNSNLKDLTFQGENLKQYTYKQKKIVVLIYDAT